MTRRGWLRRRLARSVRLRAGIVLLSLVGGPALFAELIVGPIPVVVIDPGGVAVLPAVFAPERYAGRDARAIEAMHAADHALWPLWRGAPGEAGAAPSWPHPLGTDDAGGDVLARLVYGARRALGFALGATALALALGALLGAAAGWAGRFWEEAVARPVEIVQAFPPVLVVALVLAVRPDATPWALALAVGLVRWAEVARLVRGEVVRESAEPHVLAARALGGSSARVLVRHVLPGALGPVVVSALFGVASLVLLEAAVAFVGLAPGGWGGLVAEGVRGASPAGLAAALAALGVTVAGAYLLADAVAEALDARVASRYLAVSS